MRTFVCGQCHVEYYCATKETLFFPWQNGLKVEQIEATYDEHKFPDGTPFYDFEHGETGANVYKAQHPEFELWSQGIHARSGVSCADCHMPYRARGGDESEQPLGAQPAAEHQPRLPDVPQRARSRAARQVETIQGRTTALIERAAAAMTDMLDAIRDAEAAGATEEQLAPILELQRKAMWRLDFISSENSHGLPRRPGSGPHPRRVDRLQPPGRGRRAAVASARGARVDSRGGSSRGSDPCQRGVSGRRS